MTVLDEFLAAMQAETDRERTIKLGLATVALADLGFRAGWIHDRGRIGEEAQNIAGDVSVLLQSGGYDWPPGWSEMELMVHIIQEMKYEYEEAFTGQFPPGSTEMM